MLWITHLYLHQMNWDDENNKKTNQYVIKWNLRFSKWEKTLLPLKVNYNLKNKYWKCEKYPNFLYIKWNTGTVTKMLC